MRRLLPVTAATLAALLALPAQARALDEPDTTPPATVAALAARPGDGQVRLTWANPADSDFAGVVVRRATGPTPPAGPTDGVWVYSGAGTAATETGLANGTQYAFAVFARDGVPNYAAAVSVTATPIPAVGTTLTISRSRSALTFGGQVTLAGKLSRAADGAPAAGEPVEVWYRRLGTDTWGRAAKLTTDGTGAVRWRTVPRFGAYWTLRHQTTPYFLSSESASLRVQVRQRLAVHLSATALEIGRSIGFAAAVTPWHPGQQLQLRQYVSGEWTTVQGKALASNSTGAFTAKPPRLGTYYYRVYRPADADHLAASSPTYRITVVRRTLRPGMSGSDVLWVERRLAGLHYDVGTVDGAFGYDTTHAVAAFQKVNDLARTSVVDQATWARLLGHPVPPPLRYPRAGLWVEVDLTRQVLYVGQAGALYRVVDISSGSGRLFTVDGVTERAITPTGSFRVERKINGWRTSRLGQLYRPAYFVGGYAIHGSFSVPTYPASHGCIRVTIPAMDRLYDVLRLGTPVSVYRS